MNAARALLLSLAFVATSSLAEYSPRYYFNSVGVANLTGETVTNLELRVGENVLECDTVNHNGYCTKKFGRVPFTPDQVELRWTGAEQQSQDPDIHVPAYVSTGRPLRLELEIHPGGELKWEFRQGGRNN
jgi:hypothetical protein